MNDITDAIEKTSAVWCYSRDPEALDRIATMLSGTYPLTYTGDKKGNILIITKNLKYFYYLGEPIDLELGLFPDLDLQLVESIKDLIYQIDLWTQK